MQQDFVLGHCKVRTVVVLSSLIVFPLRLTFNKAVRHCSVVVG